MEIAVFGAGYVGLVTGACLADAGHRVHLVDVDEERIAALRAGTCPLLEPGLPLLLTEGAADGRLHFTTDAAIAAGCDVVFLCVPTPPRPDGSCDTRILLEVAATIAPLLRRDAVVCIKSTVSVGTTDAVQRLLDERCPAPVHAVMNPEFLREGTAVQDFLVPDRVVIGARSEQALRLCVGLFTPFVDDERPLLTMDPHSAELCKYAANTYLAMRIAYINEIAALAEAVDADITAVRRAIGADPRIGGRYLYPGPGYGGACFPKDVPALSWIAHQSGSPSLLVDATQQANEAQRRRIVARVLQGLAGLVDPRLAIWGLTFKAHTSDCRQSIALDVIAAAAAAGVRIAAHDPAATPADLGPHAASVDRFAESALEAAEGADVLAVLTEWPAFLAPPLRRVAGVMRGKTLVDARNLLSPADAHAAGLDYTGVGRRRLG